MKKIILVLFVVLAIYVFSFDMYDLKVASPAGVVGQPYIFRTTVFRGPDDSYLISLEGHLELFFLNASLGTFTSYPDFSFNNEIYVGLGLRLGGLYAAVNGTVDNLSNLPSINDPKAAFGIVGFRRTGILFQSWSRFELSYLPNNLLVEDATTIFKFNENFDWTDASLRLVVEAQDVGYFLFAFYTGKISELMNGNYKYAFEMALPSDPIYLYVSQSFDGSWKVGIGLAMAFLNALGTYDLSTGKIDWGVSAQF